MRARTLRSRLDRLARAQHGRALRIWDASPLSHVETAHVQALLDNPERSPADESELQAFSRGALPGCFREALRAGRRCRSGAICYFLWRTCDCDSGELSLTRASRLRPSETRADAAVSASDRRCHGVACGAKYSRRPGSVARVRPTVAERGTEAAAAAFNAALALASASLAEPSEALARAPVRAPTFPLGDSTQQPLRFLRHAGPSCLLPERRRRAADRARRCAVRLRRAVLGLRQDLPQLDDEPALVRV